MRPLADSGRDPDALEQGELVAQWRCNGGQGVALRLGERLGTRELGRQRIDRIALDLHFKVQVGPRRPSGSADVPDAGPPEQRAFP